MKSGEVHKLKVLLSYVFAALIWLRKLFYRLNLFKTHVFSTPIISIGNIEMGGTGKTPFIIYLSTWLIKNKINHVIVSRGYKKKGIGLSVVSNTSHLLINNPTICGDEPLLIAKKCPSVPVIVSSNKVTAIKYAIKKFSPRLILLDDAFQSLYIKNNLNIVLINSAKPSSHFQLYPLGFLRENLQSLNRSHVVVFSKTSQQKNSFSIIKNKISSTYEGPVLSAAFSHSLLKYENQKLVSTNSKIVEPTILLSGVGDNDSFKQLGYMYCNVVSQMLQFSDHVQYENNDAIKLSLKKVANSKSSLLTTMKDFVKLEFLLNSEYNFILTDFMNIYIIDINFTIKTNQELLFELVKKLVVPRRI